MRRMVVSHRMIVPWLCHRLVCCERGELRVGLVTRVHLMLGHRRRLRQRRMCCDRRGDVRDVVRRPGLTSMRVAAGGVVVLAVVMVVIEAL
jgi:hypothetical protein